MSSRSIVRDHEHLGGRWRFDGTPFAVSEVRLALDSDPEFASTTYHRAGLSGDDLRAAQVFEFPDIRECSMVFEYGSLIVRCPCGEDTPAVGAWPEVSTVDCVCGRAWRITVNIAPKMI